MYLCTSLLQRSFFLPDIQRLFKRSSKESSKERNDDVVDESGAARWLAYESLPPNSSNKVRYVKYTSVRSLHLHVCRNGADTPMHVACT